MLQPGWPVICALGPRRACACAGAGPRRRPRAAAGGRRRGRRLQRRGWHKHGRRPRQRGRGPHAQHRRPAWQQACRCGRVARARATALPRRAAVIRAACCAASHEHRGAKPRTPRRQPTHATSSPLTARFCVPVPLSHAPVCSTHNAHCKIDKPCRCNNALPSDRENLAHLRGLRGRRGGSGARRAPVGLRVAGGRGVLGHQDLHRRQRPGRSHAAVTAHKAPFSLRATPSRRGQAGAHRQQVQCQTPLQCILCGSHKKGVSPAAGQAGRGARARRPSRSMVTVTRRRRASSASAAARSCAFRASRSCACGACAPSRTPSALKSLPRTSAKHQRDGQLVHRSARSVAAEQQAPQALQETRTCKALLQRRRHHLRARSRGLCERAPHA